MPVRMSTSSSTRPACGHLLDTYIQADASEVVANFERHRARSSSSSRWVRGAIDKLPAGIKKEPEAVAETIANNMRKVIIDERATNPKYYDSMSELLDALIEEQPQGSHRIQGIPRASCSRPPRSSEPKSPTTDVSRTGPTTAPSERSSTSSAQRMTLPSPSISRFCNNKPRLLGRQPNQGTEGQECGQGGPARRLRPLDELMELMKARNEYR